jgi:RNA polymerase sigma-70 factor (sigma-E family)
MVHDWEHQFVEYFRVRAQTLRRLAYALCGDWHSAEDLVQATFVRLYRAWPRIDTESVDAYARRTLVNAFLSARRARRREVVLAEPPDGVTPDHDVTSRVALHRALSALPAGQRAVLVLRYLEDLSVIDVSALLNISEGTVKSQTARGIQSLRDALRDVLTVKE